MRLLLQPLPMARQQGHLAGDDAELGAPARRLPRAFRRRCGGAEELLDGGGAEVEVDGGAIGIPKDERLLGVVAGEGAEDSGEIAVREEFVTDEGRIGRHGAYLYPDKMPVESFRVKCARPEIQGYSHVFYGVKCSSLFSCEFTAL